MLKHPKSGSKDTPLDPNLTRCMRPWGPIVSPRYWGFSVKVGKGGIVILLWDVMGLYLRLQLGL